jgi:hypothetical protein
LAKKATEQADMLTIDLDIARRFILGKQGLWPGRRWRGIQGAEQAMREIEYLQLDLQITPAARYPTAQPGPITHPGCGGAGHRERSLTGRLAVRPMDELPHRRVVMRRECDGLSGDSNRQDGPGACRRIVETGILREQHGDQSRFQHGVPTAIRSSKDAPWPSIICGGQAR